MTGTTWSFVAGVLISVGTALATPLAGNAATETPPSALQPQGVAPQPLTLVEVLTRVWQNHPEQAAARAAVAAGDATARQAGALTNPELSLEVENFAGSDTLRGFDGAETTLRLDQPLPLGGKPGQRRALAEAERDIAARQQALTAAELYVQTVSAFMAQLAAQQRLQLAENQVQTATQTVASIAAQIESGKVPALAAVRGRPLLIEARLERVRAEAALSAARAELTALLGNSDPMSTSVTGELLVPPEQPAPPVGAAIPHLALAAAERARAQQALNLERAQTIPDLILGAGVRRFEERGETALVAGLSLSLPLFDRNRGGIAAATARLEEARQKERGAAQRFAVDRAAVERDFASTRAEAMALQEELLPAALETFAAIDFGYRSGKFGLLDLLDAQRQLAEIQTRLLETQVACHVAAARRDALCGRFPLLEGRANLEEP